LDAKSLCCTESGDAKQCKLLLVGIGDAELSFYRV